MMFALSFESLQEVPLGLKGTLKLSTIGGRGRCSNIDDKSSE